MNTLLAVDLGNTNVTIGAFEDANLAATWRVSTDRHRTRDEYEWLLSGLLSGKGLDAANIDGVAMCSVVPPVTEMVREALENLTGKDSLLVGPGTRTGIRIEYDRVQDVGSDRVVDAVAAHALYPGSVIVVDFGTATVFDAVTADGVYKGGALAPGLSTSAEALYESTSQLRRVDLAPPDRIIGRNTTAALQSGLVYGHVGLVEGMVKRFRLELDCEEPGECTVVATGGLATLMSGLTDVFDHVNEDLTLQGLRLVYEMNT